MLQVNQGLKTYEIKNELGQSLGSITLNPSDVGIATRAAEAKKSLKKISEDAKTATDPIEAFVAADKKIRECFNYIFGCDISSIIFKNISALALCESGEYVFESTLESLMPLIEESTKTAQSNSKKRMNKYVQAYVPAAEGS